jgi:metaxin
VFVNYVEVLMPRIAEPSHSRMQVYDEAKALYKALASKLGANEYFFGDRPTTLDAYAYGFLLTQLVPDVPSRQLHFLISTHDNLGMCL